MSTPGAEWREKGEPDPHGDRYNRERHELSLGNMSDDALADAVFYYGDGPSPSVNELLQSKKRHPLVYLIAAKDRIRWLSRREAALLRTIQAQQQASHPLLSKDARERVGKVVEAYRAMAFNKNDRIVATALETLLQIHDHRYEAIKGEKP